MKPSPALTPIDPVLLASGVQLSDGTLSRLAIMALINAQTPRLAAAEEAQQGTHRALAHRVASLKEALSATTKDVEEMTADLQSLQQSLLGFGSVRGRDGRLVPATLASVPLDPAARLLMQHFCTGIDEAAAKTEAAQARLLATADCSSSDTGKKLMARVRSLEQENKELEAQLRQGPLALLKMKINLLKHENAAKEDSLKELYAYVVQMDDTVEYMVREVARLSSALERHQSGTRALAAAAAASATTRASEASTATETFGRAMDTAPDFGSSLGRTATSQAVHNDLILLEAVYELDFGDLYDDVSHDMMSAASFEPFP